METTMELPCLPMASAEQEEIRQQLDRMLGTLHFKQSRRYPAMLRYIVEETLQGRGHLLKERVLGVEVFAREPSYDTAADPIVRVTIAEIRKRIAQYYHDEAHDAEIRIELPAGHYVAEFRPGKTSVAEVGVEDHLTHVPSKLPVEGSLQQPAPELVSIAQGTESGSIPLTVLQKRSKVWRNGALGAAALLLVVLLGAVVFEHMQAVALDELWAPVIQSGKQVFFCVPTDVGRHQGALTSPADLFPSQAEKGSGTVGRPDVVTFLDHETKGENVVFSDALATIRLSNLLTLHSRDYRIKLNVNTTLDDLRQGPAILIGGLDNQWTMQTTAPLRFHFAGSDREGYWISDARKPADRRWSLDLKQEYAKVTRDYALIARVHNEQAGQPEMIVAGIGMSGTMAAGEFLVDSQQVEGLKRRIGAGFKNRDFEAVLSTDVANGVAGAPHIVDVWVQ